MSKEKDIFLYLHSIGVCKVCCLRYLCIRKEDVFTDVNKYIHEKTYLTTDDAPTTHEQQPKKLKTNSCIVCLGLLQDKCLNQTLDKICESKLVNSYDSQVFTCSVSYPACIQIREYAIKLDIDHKFPGFFNLDGEMQETAINKTWKWLIKNRIAEKLNKTFEESDVCNFSINVSMKYDLDVEELKILQKMNPEYFKKREIQHRKFRGELFSRKGVMDVLSQVRSGVFKEHSPVPPVVSDLEVYCDTIDCNHNSIFLAGRYNKYSRELPQTPWIINGVLQMETSVQKIIFEPLQRFLDIPEDGLKFSASGREDVDVRCLGRGRPFYIEYMNPKLTQITFEQFRTLEREINESEIVKVRDLQIVNRDQLIFVKQGEETKLKTYEALCISTPFITEQKIGELNKIAPLTIKQKTPLRVLHRRPLAVRDKVIHSMTAHILQDERFFKITVTTQAGTYVKEFVHGDFGRTKPNVESLSGEDNIDIVALDVTEIHMDWPPQITPI